MAICVICKTEISKYKCATCTIPYCSVNCYKQHKTLECTKKEATAVTNNSESSGTNIEDNFKTADTVSLDNLKKLGTNSGVKDLLRNPHLRDILTLVNNSETPVDIMQKVMLEPIFVEFAECCLKTVDDTKLPNQLT